MRKGKGRNNDEETNKEEIMERKAKKRKIRVIVKTHQQNLNMKT